MNDFEIPAFDQQSPVFDPIAPVYSAPVAPVKARGGKALRTQTRVTEVDPVTAVASTKTVIEDTEPSELPASVKLAAPYAFYDDNGELQSWAQGQIVDDAEVIALLVDRGAIFEA
jgi:hypothetical protein